MDTATDIFAEIRAKGIAESDITRVAGFAPRYLHSVRTGTRALHRQLEMRIRLAMARIQRGDRAHGGTVAAASYRLAVSIVAERHGVSPQDILNSDPSKRATADAQWLKAAKLRRLALYIANIYLQIPQAELARAAGMSKAAVSIAMNDIEDLRGEPETEGLLKAIEEAFG